LPLRGYFSQPQCPIAQTGTNGGVHEGFLFGRLGTRSPNAALDFLEISILKYWAAALHARTAFFTCLPTVFSIKMKLYWANIKKNGPMCHIAFAHSVGKHQLCPLRGQQSKM
jgi:hypothetical protein